MRIKLLGRSAAEWLQNSPRWQHLVAPTLSAFLRDERPLIGASGETFVAPKRGPKSGLTEKAALKILNDLGAGAETLASLHARKQEDLAERYGVKSRDTLKKALSIAASKFQAEK